MSALSQQADSADLTGLSPTVGTSVQVHVVSSQQLTHVGLMSKAGF